MKHYKGELGTFDYDEDVWEIRKNPYTQSPYLHLKKGYKGKISLPKGVDSCSRMFYGRNLKGCWFEDFDTSNVKCMGGMFEECKMPKGFSLGDKFDTSSAENTAGMFKRCEMPKGFSLGDKFDTSRVWNMSEMFCQCKLPEGFSLEDKFDTSSVEYMRCMFQECKMSKGFSLGDKFDTSNVEDMVGMFAGSEMPEGFSLGDKFNTSHVINMANMFGECEIPKGFSLGGKFDTSKVDNTTDMFNNCKLPIGFTFGDKFNTIRINEADGMFDGCCIGSKSIPAHMENHAIEEIIKFLESREETTSNSKNKQKVAPININVYKLVETSSENPIGVRLELDNVGVYVDTTIACFKKLYKLKDIPLTRKNDIKMLKQGDTFISRENESLVLEVQDFNLLDKLYCGNLNGTIEVHGLNSTNTRDAHGKICNIVSSIDKFNRIMFVYCLDAYETQLKVDIHLKTLEDIIDFVLSYYSKKTDKINVGSEKYPLSKETLMSIPKDKLISIGDFSVELEENAEGYVITGFFPLRDKGYLQD